MDFEKDYAECYDLFNQEKDYSKECNFLEQVFKRFGNGIRTILDLGCGTGLHDKELALRGYNITGLDLSEEMINIAKNNSNSKFVVGCMSNFELGEKFDAIICMFSALGYLTENKQLEDFFNCVKRHLKPEGLLIIDCWNGLGVMRELPSSREKIIQYKNLRVIRKSFPELDARNHINNVKFRVKIFENGNLVKEYEENHNVRFFFPKELEKYTNDEGFELIHTCPSFDINDKLTEKDWNMILISKLKK